VRRALRNDDIRVALDALKFTTAYLYGRPALLDARDLAEQRPVCRT